MLKLHNVITDYEYLDIGLIRTLFTTRSTLFDDIRLFSHFSTHVHTSIEGWDHTVWNQPCRRQTC